MSNISRLLRTLSRVPVLGLFVCAALVASLGSAVAQDEVDIEELRDQREEAREAQLEAQAAFDAIDAEFEDVEAAFAAADELVTLAEQRAEAIEEQLAVARLRLARTEVGLAWAEYDQSLIGDEVANLAIQEYLGAQSAGGSLSIGDPTEAQKRSAVLEVVQGASYDIIDTARSAEDRFAELRSQAEAELAEVERLTEALDSELEELEAAREVRARARDTIDSRRNEWLGRVDQLERQEADFTEQIRAEQRRLEAERARAASAANGATSLSQFDAAQSGSGYVWPTAGGIGSYFGPRVHPILGYARLHGGLDIGGRMGQPIWAAKEGRVILAGVNGGYGNTIVIDHGNGYATLYGHMSTFVATEGDWVETGQHVGNVGSTGLSTGPHLHFEVRINGSVVDPLPFLPAR